MTKPECTDAAHSLHRCPQWRVLKIRDASNGDVLFVVSGRLQVTNLSELVAAIDAKRAAPPNSNPPTRTVLDLKDLVLADEEAIRFLGVCERDGIVLRNCPRYIRIWMDSEGSTSGT